MKNSLIFASLIFALVGVFANSASAANVDGILECRAPGLHFVQELGDKCDPFQQNCLVINDQVANEYPFVVLESGVERGGQLGNFEYEYVVPDDGVKFKLNIKVTNLSTSMISVRTATCSLQ